MGLDNFLEQRLDAARVATFALLQAFLVASQFATVAVYKLVSEVAGAALRVEAVARSGQDSSSFGIPQLGQVRELTGSFEEDVVALRSYIVVPDTLADSHFREKGGATGVRAYIGFPLVPTGGGVYGVISAYDRFPRAVTKAVITVARALSRSAASELEVAEAIEATLEGKADPFEFIRSFGAISREAAQNPGADQREAVSNASKIVSAAYGFDLKSLRLHSRPQTVISESQAEEDSRPIWPAEVDSIVARAAKLLPSLPGARIDVRPGSRSLVDLDSKTLERILANLLIDAWRSSPPGTPIAVSSLPEGKWVEIVVEDKSGVFPVESLARRAHPAGSRRIGLPIARALVEEVGGKVTQVPTEEGRRYVVRLPVLRDGESAGGGPSGPGRSAGTHPSAS